MKRSSTQVWSKRHSVGETITYDGRVQQTDNESLMLCHKYPDSPEKKNRGNERWSVMGREWFSLKNLQVTAQYDQCSTLP